MKNNTFAEFFKKGITLPRIDIDPLSYAITPYRDWRVFVYFFWVAFIASAVFGGYLFVGVRNQNLFSSGVGMQSVVSLDATKLSQVMNSFAEKEKNLELLKQGKGGLVDPSR